MLELTKKEEDAIQAQRLNNAAEEKKKIEAEIEADRVTEQNKIDAGSKLFDKIATINALVISLKATCKKHGVMELFDFCSEPYEIYIGKDTPIREVEKLTVDVMGGLKLTLTVEEHITHDSSWPYGEVSHGIKIKLSGYEITKDRWYKNPISLIKAINQLSADRQAKIDMKQRKSDIKDVALKMITSLYPEASIVWIEEQEGSRHRPYRPDRFKCSSEKGSVVFSYSEFQGEVKISTYTRSINNPELNETINNLILK